MSVQLSGELEGLDKLIRRFRRAPEKFSGYMRQFMKQALPLIEREVKTRTPVNLGALRSSITHEVKGMGAQMTGIVGTPKKYAPFVELDTKPHWPPYAPIAAWVQRKLQVSGAAIYPVARGVQRAISISGTKGRHMFEKASDETKEKVGRMWADVWGEAVKKDL